MTEKSFLVSCAPGLEDLTIAELSELGLGQWNKGPGILQSHGDWDQAIGVLMQSRLASRVLLSLKTFSAKNEAMLYDQIRRIPWPDYFSTQHTFAVEVHGKVEGMAQSFAPLKIKDAICDEFRKKGMDRPSVERFLPQVLVFAYFYNGRCEISLDLTGNPLNMRGYRKEGLVAPLKESKAAGLLRFSGWAADKTLVDPFCGSGTIAIEAALMARKIGPGTLRDVKAFRAMTLFPDLESRLREAKEKTRAQALRQCPVEIVASDEDPVALKLASTNAMTAGVAKDIRFVQADARKISQKDIFIVSNPPYGVRLSDQEKATQLLSDFTRQVKHHCAPAQMALVLPQERLPKAVGLKPARKHFLSSGEIPIGYYAYELFAGSRKEFLEKSSK